MNCSQFSCGYTTIPTDVKKRLLQPLQFLLLKVNKNNTRYNLLLLETINTVIILLFSFLSFNYFTVC